MPIPATAPTTARTGMDATDGGGTWRLSSTRSPRHNRRKTDAFAVSRRVSSSSSSRTAPLAMRKIVDETTCAWRVG
jgi:hypothetical protein